MLYIALLDYQHLDHSFFMKSFAEAMALQKECDGIILHGDSPYTDRLMQTGVMREEAIIRSTRDLNHRIIALLADSGISGIGINGFQREIIRKSDDDLIVKKNWLENRPAGIHLVLSNLVWNSDMKTIEPVPLSMIAEKINKTMECNYIIIFPNDEGPDHFVQKSTAPRNNYRKEMSYTVDDIPDDLIPLPEECYFCTLAEFGKLPDTTVLQKFPN